MLSVVKKSLSDSIDDLLLNWNHAISYPYGLTKRLIQEKLIESTFTIHEGSFSIYLEDDYVGTIVLKHQKDIGLDNRIMHISIIFINPRFRNQGYGKMLLDNAKKVVSDLGATKLIVGGDMDCLFSGVFLLENHQSHEFFAHRGMTVFSRNYNLIATTPNDNPILLPDDYKIVTKLTKQDYASLIDFIGNTFSPRWRYEALHTEPNYFFVLKHNQKIIGFIRWGDEQSKVLPNSLNQYNCYSKLAGFGPLGIDTNYRGNGIGSAFVSNALKELWQLGYQSIMVDWTNLVQFYQKCGFKEICNEYIQYQHSLRGRSNGKKNTSL